MDGPAAGEAPNALSLELFLSVVGAQAHALSSQSAGECDLVAFVGWRRNPRHAITSDCVACNVLLGVVTDRQVKRVVVSSLQSAVFGQGWPTTF